MRKNIAIIVTSWNWCQFFCNWWIAKSIIFGFPISSAFNHIRACELGEKNKRICLLQMRGWGEQGIRFYKGWNRVTLGKIGGVSVHVKSTCLFPLKCWGNDNIRILYANGVNPKVPKCKLLKHMVPKWIQPKL